MLFVQQEQSGFTSFPGVLGVTKLTRLVSLTPSERFIAKGRAKLNRVVRDGWQMFVGDPDGGNPPAVIGGG